MEVFILSWENYEGMQDGLDLTQEIGRKLIHFSSIFIVLIYIFFGKNVTLGFLTILLILLLEVEYIRIEWGKRVPFFWRFMRGKEKERIGGEIFFIIGSIIAISVFSQPVASAAILMTTFGDMAAAVFGKAFGKTWIPKLENRAIEGVLAEFIVNFFVGYILLTNISVIVVMASTATFVETIVHKMDDNLLIPLFAGFSGELTLTLIKMLS